MAMLEAYAAVSHQHGGRGCGRPVGDVRHSIRNCRCRAAARSAAGSAQIIGASPDENSRWRSTDKASSRTPRPVPGQHLATAELEALLAVSGERELADPQAKVIVAQEIGGPGRIYLQRQEIAFPGDSGWYIGRADDARPRRAAQIRFSTC